MVLVVLTTCLAALTVGAPGAGARGVTASAAVPVVTGVSPTVGALDGGNQVLIQGSGFLGATAVRFGSTTAGFFYVWGDGLILAFAPAHALGQVDVTVTTPGGTSATGAGTRFTFSPPTNGELHGSVTTEDHQSATGMLVVAVDSVTQLIVAATTVLSDGTWQFTELAPGAYHAVVVGDTHYKTKLAGWDYDPFIAAPAAANMFTVTGGGTTTVGPMMLWLTTPKTSTPYDFTGDGKADAVWVDTSTGDWYQSVVPDPRSMDPDRVKLTTIFALPVAGDYDGDGRYEPAGVVGSNWVTTGTRGTIAFARPATSNPPPDVTPEAVPGMYDGNRTTVPAFYRQEDATWFIEGHAPIQFGSGPSAPNGPSQAGKVDFDRPMPADYDGDGRTDLAVWNPRTSVWKIRRSTDGVVVTKTYGGPYMYPAPADYNGDGKTDLAFQTTTGFMIDGVPVAPDGFGALGMVDSMPAPADYDGDRKADRAVAEAVHNGYLQMRTTTGTGLVPRMSTPGTSKPIAASSVWPRYMETANLSVIWRCVGNPIYC